MATDRPTGIICQLLYMRRSPCDVVSVGCHRPAKLPDIAKRRWRPIREAVDRILKLASLDRINLLDSHLPRRHDQLSLIPSV